MHAHNWEVRRRFQAVSHSICNAAPPPLSVCGCAEKNGGLGGAIYSGLTEGSAVAQKEGKAGCVRYGGKFSIARPWAHWPWRSRQRYDTSERTGLTWIEQLVLSSISSIARMHSTYSLRRLWM